jgi:hypothetical protein
LLTLEKIIPDPPQKYTIQNSQLIGMKHPTIFITIPAYEDPQLINTIEGALNNALHPSRLFFCIGMQYRELPDISKYITNPNFKFLFYDVDQRPGIYHIRREMAIQHSSQDYFLMIDSHMTFAEYWDESLINDYKNICRLYGKKTIMSKPCSEKIGPTFENGNINDRPHWKANFSNDIKNIQRTLIPWVTSIPWTGQQFIRSYYACHHFFFTSTSFIDEVGFSDKVRAYGEELIVSVASFMSGWDIYLNPAYNALAHNPKETTKAIYNKDHFSIGDGKLYTAIEDSEDDKLEISKFILTGKSKIIEINAIRSADEYYNLANLKDAQNTLKKEILGV